jgi:hypothetical protein
VFAVNSNDERPPQTQNVSSAQASQFSETTRAKVVSEIGQPIEGFEPFMFLEVYAGLMERDFHNVDAAIGRYAYQNGTLIYDTQGEVEIHSAARAISDEGMATFLGNVASRLNINLEDAGAVDAVIGEIDQDQQAQEDNGDGQTIEQTVTVDGEIVCLPHKDQSGPQTLECAFGLMAAEGIYYGLAGISDLPSPINIDTGVRVRVEGELEQPEDTNIYDVQGVITVRSITRI